MADPGLRSYALAGGVLYGPVRSRRMGVSLGVNILPFGLKLCSFNCGYCQCGWSAERVDGGSLSRHRFPDASEVAGALRERLAGLRTAGKRLDSITFSGNGEPTMHPDFLGVVKAVLEARDAEMPGARVDILSNSAHLDRPGVIEGLNLLDERHMKLDAGSDRQMARTNAPLVPVDVESVVRNLSRLKDLVLQAMFVRGPGDNTGEESVAEWIEAVRRIRPKAVHLYSVDRVPAHGQAGKVERQRLEEIAREVAARTGLPVEVF